MDKTDARIAYKNDEGGVSVVVPAPEWIEAHSIQELIEKDVPSGVEFAVMSASDLPEDRTFRNAWTLLSDKVFIDMSKAKATTHERRRAARDKEFAPLDIKATIPAEAAQAEIARQSIREKYAAVQERIDASATPEELKAIIAEYDL